LPSPDAPVAAVITRIASNHQWLPLELALFPAQHVVLFPDPRFRLCRAIFLQGPRRDNGAWPPGRAPESLKNIATWPAKPVALDKKDTASRRAPLASFFFWLPEDFPATASGEGFLADVAGLEIAAGPDFFTPSQPVPAPSSKAARTYREVRVILVAGVPGQPLLGNVGAGKS